MGVTPLTLTNIKPMPNKTPAIIIPEFTCDIDLSMECKPLTPKTFRRYALKLDLLTSIHNELRPAINKQRAVESIAWFRVDEQFVKDDPTPYRDLFFPHKAITMPIES